MINELGDAVSAAAVDLTAQRREVVRLRRLEAIEARRLASIENTRQSERRAVFGDIHRELAALNLQQQDPELGISVLPEVVVAPDASVILGVTVNQEDLLRIVQEEADGEYAASLTGDTENVRGPIRSWTERLLPEDDFSFDYDSEDILAQQLQEDLDLALQLGTEIDEPGATVITPPEVSREFEDTENVRVPIPSWTGTLLRGEHDFSFEDPSLQLLALQLQEDLDLESALRLSAERVTEKDEPGLTVITPAVVSVTSSVVPVPMSNPAAPVKVNYSFMMAAMAHPAMKAVAAVIFVASLLFLGLGLTAGLAFVPITIGLVLASVGLFAGATLFAGQNRASKLKEEELSDTVAPLAGL